MASWKLPTRADAAENPGKSAQDVQAAVRESLKEEFRAQYAQDETFLDALCDLLDLHLGALDTEVDEHEEACANCFKLARNLSVDCPFAQEFWWRKGVPEHAMSRICSDMQLLVGRSSAWRCAVLGFLSNCVAGHDNLRASAVESWFPHKLAAACTLCFDRPELVFALVQNLIGAAADGESVLGKKLLGNEHGHCILYVLLSLCCGAEANGANSDKVWEWATVFLNGLWMTGGFEQAYRGIKALSASQLHEFLKANANVGKAPKAASESDEPPAGLARIVGQLCGQAEALGLLWHSIHGLLGGANGDSSGQEVAALAKKLLRDCDFVKLAQQEMASLCARICFEFQLEWLPEVPSEEAAGIIGLDEPHDADALTLASLSHAHGASLKCNGRAAIARLFGDMVDGAISLVVAANSTGNPLPPRLAATYLVANLACMDAMHRRRFGDPAAGVKSDLSPKEAAELQETCCMLEQMRLCGNVLYGNRAAQDFVRVTGGLRVLLSNCYADEHLPMLRENGVFAIRNATHQNLENQALAKSLLQERKTAVAEGRLPAFTAAQEIEFG